VILGRDQAYTGVLIDDLVTKGTDEPYRRLTARAEYRLLLRQDNADARLTQIGRDVGLVKDARYDAFMRKRERVEREIRRLRETTASAEAVDRLLSARGEAARGRGMTLARLLLRNVGYGELAAIDDGRPALEKDEAAQAVTSIKYEGYIEKQRAQVRAAAALESKQIPDDIAYDAIRGLRIEARAKLSTIRPRNVGQAARISGVSPADISVLLVYLAAAGR
jgi:tRNA uridine 5-carboxymethylaminomethyl modification enzyme